MKKLSFIFLSFVSFHLLAQDFTKGVNVTNWFQARSAKDIRFTAYTKKDFEQIKSLGCDVVRLPINLHHMTNGAPDYKLDANFISMLDQAVDWAEALQLNLILDNHTGDVGTDGKTSPTIQEPLLKVWAQMAKHYKSRSKYIYYEVLNEPHGIDDAVWAKIQQAAIDTIRRHDTEHYIIVGPADWNSYKSLAALPVYSDNKLIYTFHFYDPFVFTHQGATWTPLMSSLSGVPFPYNSTMPVTPTETKGSWVEHALNNYQKDGTVEAVHKLIDIAVAFKTERNVKIYCGEFGVFMKNSNATERVYWYEEVRKYLEEKNIPWTTWDYRNSFGLFNKGSKEKFEDDLNIPLLKALGFSVPDGK